MLRLTGERRAVATGLLFAGGLALVLGAFVLGFTVRAPLDSYNPNTEEINRTAREFVGSGAAVFGTYALYALAAAGYGLCLFAVWRGLPRAFPLAVAGCAIACAALLPMRPLSSPDLTHLAADVRALWLHGEYPAFADGRPDRIDDPIADRVVVFRDAPSGYGPVAYVIGGLPLPFVGDDFAANLMGQKAVAGLFLVLSTVLIGLLARALGKAPGLPAAAFGLNPLMLYMFPGEGHNDTIMVAFGVAAMLFVVRSDWRSRATGTGLAALSVLSKYGLIFAAPIVLAYWFKARRREIAVVSAVLMGAVVVGVLTEVLPAGGSSGPATAIAFSNPWHILENATLSRQSDYDVAWIGFGYFWMLMALLYIVYEHPLETPGDLVAAVALFFAIFAFFCFPGLLPWYTAWFLPFALLSGRRWVAVGSAAFAALMFLPSVGVGADAFGVRPSFASSTSTAIAVTWLATAAIAFGVWRFEHERAARPAARPQARAAQRRRART